MINNKYNFSLKNVQIHWDKVAEEYDHSNDEYSQTHDQRWIEAKKYIDFKPKMIILDIFCRTGDSIKYIKTGIDIPIIIGAELSKKMIIKAKKKYLNNSFVHVSPYKLPFKNNIFDVVLSLESLEHIPEPFLFLLEIRRVLKPNGRLIMSLPPSTAEYTSILVDLFHLHHGEGPHKFLSSKTVKELIQRVDGLELIKHKGTLFIPVGPTFLKNLGKKIENRIQRTPFNELGIRQFYICKK